MSEHNHPLTPPCPACEAAAAQRAREPLVEALTNAMTFFPDRPDDPVVQAMLRQARAALDEPPTLPVALGERSWSTTTGEVADAVTAAAPSPLSALSDATAPEGDESWRACSECRHPEHVGRCRAPDCGCDTTAPGGE